LPLLVTQMIRPKGELYGDAKCCELRLKLPPLPMSRNCPSTRLIWRKHRHDDGICIEGEFHL
jgi:hypothetical protein